MKFNKHKISLRIIRSSLLVALSGLLVACGGGGGGGGGGDFIGSAQVTIRTSPQTIDTGDRTQTEVAISRVNDSGVILKLRTPLGLKYVLASAFLKADNSEYDVSPQVNAVQGNFNYVVFFLPQSAFSKNKEGKLTVLFEATSRISDGKIEVDPDVDDPTISNATEFDITNPEFLGEDEVRIEVKG